MASRRKALCAAALALAAATGRAQEIALDRARGLPVGLAVPSSAAGAEEPSALAVNPAGLGFVGGATFQYFFEGGQAGSLSAHGAYLAVPLGIVVPALSLEWVSPGDRGPRYRKTCLGLAVAAGQVFSIGFAWNWFSSPDPALDKLFGMDVGLTLRPLRQLSLGAAALGIEERLAGRKLPVRFDFGAAVRLFDDSATISSDLYADDQGRGDFRVGRAAVGIDLDLRWGVGLRAQYLFPVRSGAAGLDAARAVQLVLTLNQPHAGVSFGYDSVARSGQPDSSALFGLRISSQRYRGYSPLRTVPVVDLQQALRRPSPVALLLGADPDRFGALLRRLEDVRADPGVAGLVVKIGPLPVREGRVDELRAALASVKARKPVLAYLIGGETREYFLTTAASEVYAPPGSLVVVNGLASSSLFLRDGLARLGVAFEAVAAGRYKTAPEALTRSGPSDAEREVTASLLDDRFARLARGIAAARGLSEARVRELVDVGAFTTEEARQAGLIDGALWPDQLEERARVRSGGASIAGRVDEGPLRAAERWGPRPYVAVVRVEGAIASGRSRTEPLSGMAIAGSETLEPLLRRLARDDSVKAIVVRVESPGGDGFASDLIWHALQEARQKGKPVVASLGDVAASGGYLVAAGADAIVAEPSTLTGSIGVFVLKADLSGLLAKLSLNVAADQRGANARIASAVKPWSPEERKLVERQVEAFYGEFVAKVADGRRLPREEVERVAQGRVWTGEQALARRLVDRLGTLADAVALARELAGRGGDDLEARRVEAAAGLGEGLAAGLESLAAEQGALRAVASKLPELRAASLLSEMGPVLALPTPWLLGEGGQ
jgi:protease IV